MISRTALVLLAMSTVGVAATGAARGVAPTAVTAVAPIANRAYQATVAHKFPRSVGQDTFTLKASASRTRVTISDANINVPCSDDAGVFNALIGSRTVAVSPTGAFKFSLGHPAVVIAGRFATRATATGTIAFSGRAGGGLCSLNGPWSATLVPLAVTERYVGATTGGAKVTFSVTHPENDSSALSVGNFAVGDVTAACPATYAGGSTRPISFEDGSVGPVKHGHFSNGDGAPASSSDEDLAFTVSGNLTGHTASGVVGAGDRNGCGYSSLQWTATRVSTSRATR